MQDQLLIINLWLLIKSTKIGWGKEERMQSQDTIHPQIKWKVEQFEGLNVFFYFNVTIQIKGNQGRNSNLFISPWNTKENKLQIDMLGY